MSAEHQWPGEHFKKALHDTAYLEGWNTVDRLYHEFIRDLRQRPDDINPEVQQYLLAIAGMYKFVVEGVKSAAKQVQRRVNSNACQRL